ncbi:MAG: amidohydrolase [Candidatus Cloacimonetes bacterium]|nr:amidohydrolase [Candidatus Cloacimonadota bacterium]MCF7814823.1 amidohydrolase [Candidatus Cloacimonadota bacterium]MCF7883323.1 amidohydrolase [Candidatus Cloacimonadota bacterium]
MDLYKIRKDLHQIPELGFQEYKTTKYIKSVLSGFSELEIHEFDFPGLLVEYKKNKGKYKIFRADMDALPIQEANQCDFVSIHHGKMHACGHDIHMTILIGLIEKVIKNQPDQNVLFLFQPAEEGYGGAERILNTGMLDNFEISEAFALHVNGHLPVGTIESKPGVFFANTQEISVKFIGRSAHVAFPQNGRNALAAGADFYLNLQEKIQQQFPNHSKAICEFGFMQAGTVMNAIAAECNLDGTMRAFEEEDWQKVHQLLKTTAAESAKKYDLKHEIIYKSYYKRVVNNKQLHRKLEETAKNLGVNYIQGHAVFTGEDFGYLTDKYKGILFWLGVHSGTKMDLHSPDFLPDKKAIDVGVKVLYSMI